jgi:hypothetical protein
MRESVQSPLCELDVFLAAGDEFARNLVARYLAQVQTAPGDWHLRDQPRRVAGLDCWPIFTKRELRRSNASASPRSSRLPCQRTLIENASNNEVCDAKLIASLSARPVRQG